MPIARRPCAADRRHGRIAPVNPQRDAIRLLVKCKSHARTPWLPLLVTLKPQYTCHQTSNQWTRNDEVDGIEF